MSPEICLIFYLLNSLSIENLRKSFELHSVNENRTKLLHSTELTNRSSVNAVPPEMTIYHRPSKLNLKNTMMLFTVTQNALNVVYQMIHKEVGRCIHFSRT